MRGITNCAENPNIPKMIVLFKGWPPIMNLLFQRVQLWKREFHSWGNQAGWRSSSVTTFCPNDPRLWFSEPLHECSLYKRRLSQRGLLMDCRIKLLSDYSRYGPSWRRTHQRESSPSPNSQCFPSGDSLWRRRTSDQKCFSKMWLHTQHLRLQREKEKAKERHNQRRPFLFLFQPWLSYFNCSSTPEILVLMITCW